MFVPMPNNCYLQVCGMPLNNLLVILSGKPSSPFSDRVNRSRIFYDERFIKKPGFSGQHVLCHHTCAPTVSFARHLCRVIFDTGPQHGRLHKRYRGMVTPMQQLVHNHMKLRYGFFFAHLQLVGQTYGAVSGCLFCVGVHCKAGASIHLGL